jgi:hypothetical protein
MEVHGPINGAIVTRGWIPLGSTSLQNFKRLIIRTYDYWGFWTLYTVRYSKN